MRVFVDVEQSLVQPRSHADAEHVNVLFKHLRLVSSVPCSVPACDGPLASLASLERSSCASLSASSWETAAHAP